MAVPGERSLSRWLPWVALAAFAVCTQLWVESDWRPGWDSSLHILTAQSLRAGQGYSYLDQPFTLRPPGLSWLLSFFLSEGPLDAPLLNRVMMALAASSAAALYFALSRVAGQWPALAIALLFGTSLAEVRLFNTIASEHPFATLLFLGAGWLEVARRRSSAGLLWALAAAAALAAAVYMRSAALLAVPAVAVVALRGPPRARRHAWIAVFVIALLVSPWIWHTRTVGASLPPSDQLLLSDYVTATLRVDPGDPASAWVSPAGWLQRILSNGGRMLIDLGRTVLNVGTLPVGGILAALSLAGIALAGRRRPSVFEGFAILYSLLLWGGFLLLRLHRSRNSKQDGPKGSSEKYHEVTPHHVVSPSLFPKIPRLLEPCTGRRHATGSPWSPIEDGRRNRDAEGLGRLQVDHQIELSPTSSIGTIMEGLP